MTKTSEVSVTWLIKFSKEEIMLMRSIIMFTSFKQNAQGQLDFYVPGKKDELVCVNIYKEIKKAFQKNEQWRDEVVDKELEFGTMQKALVIKRLNEFPLSVTDLEIKYDLIEKLK